MGEQTRAMVDVSSTLYKGSEQAQCLSVRERPYGIQGRHGLTLCTVKSSQGGGRARWPRCHGAAVGKRVWGGAIGGV